MRLPKPQTPPPEALPRDLAMQEAARIYIAYHDRRPVLNGQHLFPIQVGRAAADFTLAGTQGDDTGDHISELNPEYCELTAHYWAWKNAPGQGPIGLMHYRRLFDLSGRLNPRGHVERFVLDFDPCAYAADIEHLFRDRPVQENELIVPRPVRLIRPILSQYRRHHHIEDLMVMRDVVADRHGDFLPDLERSFRGNRFIMANMFVMPRPVLDHYSRLLFAILDETRHRLTDNPSRTTIYQRRYMGFLAERIMTAYVLGNHLRDTFPELKIAFKGIVNIDRDAPGRAGVLRLMRFCLQQRISLRDGMQVIREGRAVKTRGGG